MGLPTGSDWPDLDEYKQWARINDNTDDVAIDEALQAVEIAVVSRCSMLETVTACPPDVQYAVKLWTNRLLSRRNSPDGIVGVADLGIATISKFDKDITQMLNPYLDMVLG